MKKYFQKKTSVILILSCLVLSSAADYLAAADQPDTAPNMLRLSLEQVSRIGLANNLDIQIAKYDAYIKRTDLDDSRAVFDTFLNARASYLNDQQKSASSLSGTKSRLNNY
ncbi:MAG: hypothetical protein V1747_05610, partial [Candidatus Omnitrophota bacterium]